MCVLRGRPCVFTSEGNDSPEPSRVVNSRVPGSPEGLRELRDARVWCQRHPSSRSRRHSACARADQFHLCPVRVPQGDEECAKRSDVAGREPPTAVLALGRDLPGPPVCAARAVQMRPFCSSDVAPFKANSRAQLPGLIHALRSIFFFPSP